MTRPLSPDLLHASRVPSGGVGRPALLLAGFILAALAVRLPAMVFSEQNWDEALYRLMADSLLAGHVPYTEIWDRKPVGIFLIYAAADGLSFHAAAAIRVATVLSVGIGAWCMAGLGRAMLASPAGGVAGGLLYVAYSAHTVAGSNTELFFVTLNLAGFWLLLQAASLDWPVDQPAGRALRRAFLAGLLMGAAVQVKYNAAFDIAGFAAMLLVMRPHLVAPLLVRPLLVRPFLVRPFLVRSNLLQWRHWRPLLAVAMPASLGIVLPTLAAMAWYGAIGRFGLWFTANITANAGLVGATAPPLELEVLPFLLGQNRLVVLGTAACALAAPWLADTRQRRQGLAALSLWLAADAAALLVMRRFADHMMVQALPVLCLATGFVLARLVEAATAQRPAVWPTVRPILLWTLPLLAYAGVNARSLARPYAAAVEIVARRTAAAPHWGDLTATLGAELRQRLRPGDGLYVFGGPLLGVYAAAGRAPPTRFAFVEHLWGGYAPVDGPAELARILATRPAFIVRDDLLAPGTEQRRRFGAPAEPIFAQLDAALARDYVAEPDIPPFISYGGARLGAASSAVIFHRRMPEPRTAEPRTAEPNTAKPRTAERRTSDSAASP